MSFGGRELYRSPNGDTWYLTRAAAGHPVVKHVANQPSGGNVAFLEIGTFLATNTQGPEHRELLRLIGSLVVGQSSPSERSSSETGPDRKHANEEDSYEVADLAERHGISNDQASRLIRQIGPDRERLDLEADRLTKR